MIRVAVVDDHPVVRDGIVANLSDANDVTVVGSASSAAEAVRLVRASRPDVALLDLELPDRSGLEVIAELRGVSPRTRVVVFTAYGGEERVTAALERGADAYVLKGTSSDDLVAAVRAAASGEGWLSPGVTGDAIAALRRDGAMRLTSREGEILRLVAEGLSNKGIASRLGIAERTVKFHVGEILARLGAENRAQAVAIASQRGLLRRF